MQGQEAGGGGGSVTLHHTRGGRGAITGDAQPQCCVLPLLKRGVGSGGVPEAWDALQRSRWVAGAGATAFTGGSGWGCRGVLFALVCGRWGGIRQRATSATAAATGAAATACRQHCRRRECRGRTRHINAALPLAQHYGGATTVR